MNIDDMIDYILSACEKRIEECNPSEPLRLGQTAFNALSVVDPNFANQIQGTEFDPFYDDGRMFAFWAKLLELLNES